VKIEVKSSKRNKFAAVQTEVI